MAPFFFFFVQIVHPGLMTIEQSGRHYTWDRIRRSWVQSVSRTTHPSHKSTQLTDNSLWWVGHPFGGSTEFLLILKIWPWDTNCVGKPTPQTGKKITAHAVQNPSSQGSSCAGQCFPSWVLLFCLLVCSEKDLQNAKCLYFKGKSSWTKGTTYVFVQLL